jgi:hypothetical protein
MNGVNEGSPRWRLRGADTPQPHCGELPVKFLITRVHVSAVLTPRHHCGVDPVTTTRPSTIVSEVPYTALHYGTFMSRPKPTHSRSSPRCLHPGSIAATAGR